MRGRAIRVRGFWIVAVLSGGFSGCGKNDSTPIDAGEIDAGTIDAGQCSGTPDAQLGPACSLVGFPSVPWLGVDGLAWAAVAGDFNGDSKLDLAVHATNFDPPVGVSSREVSIFLGEGDGTFGAKRDFAVDLAASGGGSMTAGDLNGDGNVDLSLAGDVLLGNGDGTFQPHVDHGLGYVGTLGDLNGDTKLDLVVTTDSTRVVSVRLGNGDGTFLPKTDIQLTGPNPRSIVTADINADAKLDVVLGQGPGATVLLGNGNGTLQAPVVHDFAGGVHSVVVADVDGDGKLDLCGSRFSQPSIGLLLGNGDGTFQARIDHPVSSAGSLAVVDVDGDANRDLLFTNGTGVGVLRANGGGSFQAEVDYLTGFSPGLFIPADFDADSKLDLAVPNLGDGPISVSILRNQGNGTFETRVDYPTLWWDGAIIGEGIAVPPEVMGAFGMADLNRDGVSDIVIGNTGENSGEILGGTVSVRLGRSDGTLAPQINYRVAPMVAELSVAVGDVNGDCNPDVVSDGSTAAAAASLMIGNGDGTFMAATEHGPPGYARGIGLGDLDGDGDLDLVLGKGSVTASGPDLRVLLNAGNATFAPEVNYKITTHPVFANTSHLLVDDLNKDGREDVVVVNGANYTLSVLLGRGDGTLYPAVEYAFADSPSGGVVTGFVAIGDLDGDQHVDLVVSHAGTSTPVGKVSMLHGNGDGTFAPRTDLLSILQPGNVALRDFNRDGKLDIAVADYARGTVAILFSDGDGSFQPPVHHGTGWHPVGLGVSDLDGDGTLEIITAGRTISIMKGTCGSNP